MTNNEEKEMKIKFDEIVNKELIIVNLFNSLYQNTIKNTIGNSKLKKMKNSLYFNY
jgi:hypothetical protein